MNNKMTNLMGRILDDIAVNTNNSVMKDFCLDHRILVLPESNVVYFIVDEGTDDAFVGEASINQLCLCELRDLAKYRYYTTREEAEAAMRRCNK